MIKIQSLTIVLARNNASTMELGTRIRVSTSVMIYHHPEQRNIAFDMKGQEGEIIAIATSWQGRPVSANYPYVVKFSPKLKTHLTEHEIESIS